MVLWSAEKAARINVASKSTRRHAAEIVHATCIRALEKSRCSRPASIRITAGRRRPIPSSLIFLNNLTR